MVLLNEINTMDEKIFSKIFLLGQGPPMINTKLQPIPILIGRILAYNICPKMDSSLFSRELSSFVYAIMGNLEVNWAQVI